MKKGLFCIVMLFCICVAMNAQGLKTYSGTYNDSYYRALSVPKATYTYKNAKDGTRIFEGNFTWQCTHKPNIAYDKATGKFHNNYKVGLWTYISKTASSTTLLKVNYNSKGHVDGIYDYSETEYNKKTGKKRVVRSLKANIKNGNAIGQVTGHLVSFDTKKKDGTEQMNIGDASFTGQTDAEGFADGLWKITMKYVSDDVNVFYVTFNHGVCKDAYCIDNSTGNKIEYENVDIITAIYDLVSSKCSKMEDFVYRGGSPWDGIILDPRWVEWLKAQSAESWQCEILPTADYEGYADDEAFIQAKSNVPNILYKLNGTEVECSIDEQGKLYAINFTKMGKDKTAIVELKRCLNLLKFKPALRKGIKVKCKTIFSYDGNIFLPDEETKERPTNVEAEENGIDGNKSLPDEETKERTTNVEAEKNAEGKGIDGIEEKCFDVVEEMPSFPGGSGALSAWLSNNIQYPKQARESGIQGRVIVEFIVEVDGSISNVKIGRSVDKDLDNEALRLVKGMPKWNPGKHNGTEVRVKYSIPILFRVS